jgi:hypothetical protein
MSQPPYPPHPGQPGPDPQGGYPPPSYPGAQPCPSQPGQPDGYPPPDGAPPKKKRTGLKIVLIVVAALLVLCVGGIGLAVFMAKDKVEDVVAAAKITVVEPQTLGGREKVSDPQLAGSVQSLDSEMRKIDGTTSSVGAIYGDLQKQDVVMIAAASTLAGTAQSRFDEFSSGLNSGGFSVSKLQDTDPGPLSGIAKCGDSSAGGVPTAVCVWSDAGSVGMVAMLFKDRADLEKEFVSIRGQVEQKA